MKSIREKLNFDHEFQNFILQKPTLSQESLNAYTMTLVNFIKFTDEPFYKTVQELRTLQNDRIENNMIIRFNPNQSRINTLYYEFIEFLRNQGCSNTSIESYVRSLRAYFRMDDEQTILDEIQTKENEINAYKERLCHIRKRKEIEAESNRPLEKAMASLNRMHERLGVIGENQISYIAGSNNLEFHRLKEECEKEGMNIVPFSEVPKY